MVGKNVVLKLICSLFGILVPLVRPAHIVNYCLPFRRWYIQDTGHNSTAPYKSLDNLGLTFYTEWSRQFCSAGKRADNLAKVSLHMQQRDNLIHSPRYPGRAERTEQGMPMGSNNIPARVLKSCTPERTAPLTKLFQTDYTTGIYW